jgi:hypothetical protein
MSERKIQVVAALITLALCLALLGVVLALCLATGLVVKMSPAVMAGVAVAAARARRRQQDKHAR